MPRNGSFGRQVPYILKGSDAYRSNGTLIAHYLGNDGYFTESLTTFGHRVSQLGKGIRDIGGPFSHEVTRVSNAPQGINVTDSFGNHLSGDANAMSIPDIVTEVTTLRASVHPSSKGDMNAFGTTAIARCNPDNPVAGLAAFLGELHEGIPRGTIGSMQAKAKRFRALGSDYLNVEFGWKPFVNDIRNLCHSVVHSHDVVKQYHRDSGKLIRRRYNFPDEITVQNVTDVGAKAPYPLSSTLFHGSGGTRRRTRKWTTKTWFSGAFCYYLNVGEDQLSKLDRHYHDAQHVLGIGLTPDVVWELTPWSWLVDWETNVGDVLTNTRAFMFDGLVMPYGYIMREVRAESTVVLDIPAYWKDGSNHNSAVYVSYALQKREEATPWGFGLDLSDLSARQVAILAALGLVLLL